VYLSQASWIMANACGVPGLIASIVVFAVWVIYATRY